MSTIVAPLTGQVVAIASPGDDIGAGGTVAVIESMKMEHHVATDAGGLVTDVLVAVGADVEAGAELAVLDPSGHQRVDEPPVDEDGHRPDLEELRARRARLVDAARPDAVARRHAAGRRTARENIADLVDDGSFVELGGLAIAAQRRRRDLDDLIARTPADGLVGGIATVNADRFGREATECLVASYDYMVLAGTQGMTNHRKKDRLFDLARRRRLPVVLYTEGGGGRPGDTDVPGVSWLDCLAFALFGRLAGHVPLIGVNAGYCFAGNAALLGCCDVVIATEDSNIGMGGPAMIEGGGLGSYAPDDVGPAAVHEANGVIDVLVADEAEATEVARRLLGYVQGVDDRWTAGPDDVLRRLVPGNRKHGYDMRHVIDALFDHDSVLELRPRWNPGIITAFGRIEGRPIATVANNPLHLAGAIDTGGARKSIEFLRLCERWRLPVLYLCDTPGFMVGPDSDAEGLPRLAGELFRTGSSLSVPFGTIITRKGYGLGAQAMAGGGFKEPLFTVSWPTGEFGPMGLEGAVQLGFSRELAAVDDDARQRLFDELVAKMYEHGKAINVASHFEIDDVIDPAETRRWVSRFLR